MKLCEIVVQGAIVADLQSAERDAAVAELVSALVGAGAASESIRDEILQAILERERRGSTGFGKGVAVPHVKHPAVSSMRAAIGISASGIDFNALDKQRVYTIFLLLSPADKPEDHLQAMEVIFKNLSQDRFRRFLRQAGSADEVWGVLSDADNQRLGD